jgi:polyisoprenoid-binding protein YceI
MLGAFMKILSALRVVNGRSLLSAAIFFAVALPSADAAEVFKIAPPRSIVGFKVHQFVGTVTGKFRQFRGVIELDREHPEKSSVVAMIQVKSINTGIAKRDAHLCSEEFFNVAKFPEITFKSRSVKQTGPESGDIVGDFTMHGVTKPRTLHVKLLTSPSGGAATHWQVTTEPLSRREFDLHFSKTLESVSMIGDQVAVNLEIEATKAN